MTLEQARQFFGWCSAINIAILVYWWLILMLARDFVYRLHGRWFTLTREKFDSIHYAGMAFFKILVFVFNIVPYLALLIVG